MQPGCHGGTAHSGSGGRDGRQQAPQQQQRVAAAGGGGEDGEHCLECRRFEVADLAVEIRQDVRGSNALRPLDDDRVWADGGGGGEEQQAPPLILTAEDLSRVGLVVWQAGFVVADLLLRRPPFGTWHGAQLLDLGCGTGLVGILLALAGAEVTLTDQAHILPLTEANVKANLVPGLHRYRLVPYTWGQGDAAAALLNHAWAETPAPAASASAAGAAAAGAAAAPGWQQPAAPSTPLPEAVLQPAAAAAAEAAAAEAAGAAPPLPAPCYDVIVAADVVYQPECYADLAATLRALAAPHTLLFVAFKRRGLREDGFLGLLEAAGFAVQEVPQAQLALEYQGGSYRVVRACRIE